MLYSFKGKLMKDVYITRISKFLPNNSVENDQIEEKLGFINGKSSRRRNSF